LEMTANMSGVTQFISEEQGARITSKSVTPRVRSKSVSPSKQARVKHDKASVE
jgi:hypothetical protein